MLSDVGRRKEMVSIPYKDMISGNDRVSSDALTSLKQRNNLDQECFRCVFNDGLANITERNGIVIES
jgi:hypothetical protein